MNTNSPSIEVHVPLLNEVGSLERLFQSFERQTFSDFVVCIHDNASDDGSTQEISKLVGKNPRYRHIVYGARKDVWAQSARVHGYPKHARFISVRSANDFLLPDYYGEVFEILESKPEVGLAYSHGFELPEGGTKGTHNPASQIRTLGMDKATALEHVVSKYTQSFSLWGTYRQSLYEALNQMHCYGADHVLIAQVALCSYIECTTKPLDVMVTRPRPLTASAADLGLNGMWTSHHPELLSGMSPKSAFTSPDIYAPFCSMLDGHLKMLRFQRLSDQELALFTSIVSANLFARFGTFIRDEITRVTEVFPELSESCTTSLSHYQLQFALTRYVPSVRFSALKEIYKLYEGFLSINSGQL